jgi:hypothetical protein
VEHVKSEIVKMSSRLRTVVTIALLLLPVLWIGDILQALGVGYVDYGAPDKRLPLYAMPLWLKIAAALLRGAELIPIAGGLFTLRSLLGEWREGEIFTTLTLAHFRRIGVWVILLAAVELASSVAISQLAWLSGAAGFAVHLNLNIAALLIGVLVMLLARIMHLGVGLQEQADRTI